MNLLDLVGAEPVKAPVRPADPVPPTTPEALRDRGLGDVGGSFVDEICSRVPGWFAPGDRIAGEDIRLQAEAAGLEAHHQNVWGAVVMALVRRKVLVSTPEYRKARDLKSHARRVRLYVVQDPSRPAAVPVGLTRGRVLELLEEEEADAAQFAADQSPPGSDWVVFRRGMEAAVRNLRARILENP